MKKFSLAVAACAVALVGSVTGSASAQERVPDPPPPNDAQNPTVVTAPPGSGGVTVVAPTAGGGTVVASQCRQVVVNGAPTYVMPSGEPCPQYAPYAPYQPYAAGGRSAYDGRPHYSRDPDRTGALIASSIVWGVGSLVTGTAYLLEKADCSFNGDSSLSSSSCSSVRSSYITYGAIMAITPSIPRFVMGDYGKGLLYTGLRAASVFAASAVNFGSDVTNAEMGFLLGFAAPVALGIVDLVTTPHREDLDARVAQARGVTGVAPVALADKRGTHGALLAVEGRF